MINNIQKRSPEGENHNSHMPGDHCKDQFLLYGKMAEDSKEKTMKYKRIDKEATFIFDYREYINFQKIK